MSFFKELGLNFSKEPKEVQETKRLIKESEDKRDALIQALAQEEQRILSSNTEHFTEMGKFVYENYSNVKANGFKEELQAGYDFVKENEEKLAELTRKKEDVMKRYNDEIDILKLNLQNMEEEHAKKQAANAPAPAPNQDNNVEVNNEVKFCPNCGTKNADAAKFCGNCGAKLD